MKVLDGSDKTRLVLRRFFEMLVMAQLALWLAPKILRFPPNPEPGLAGKLPD